jgi:hypothetical protein
MTNFASAFDYKLPAASLTNDRGIVDLKHFPFPGMPAHSGFEPSPNANFVGYGFPLNFTGQNHGPILATLPSSFTKLSSSFTNTNWGGLNVDGYYGSGNNGRPRPAESDPLGVLTWYLESGSNSNCFIRTPLAEFEIHQYNFIPFRQTTAANKNSVSFPIVALSIVRCAQRSKTHPEQASFESDYELRLTIVRHVLKEMIRLQKWSALMVYRVNDELAPHMDIVYQHASQELNKLQPQIHPVITEPKHKSIQVIIDKSKHKN